MNKKDKIAMKISEEEYKSILPILKENGLILGNLYWTKIRCYIVNKDCDEKNISLYEQADYNQERVLLPYNKELFLQYCGINTEETLQEYIKRVNPTLYASFLAEKELINRKPLLITEDNVDVFENDVVYWVTDYNHIQWCIWNKVNNIKNEKNKYFSTAFLASEYLSNNTPQKTVDGFEIERGETMFVVDTNFYNLHQSVGGHYKKDNGKHLLFKNKVNAINHIILEKKVLSLSDMDFLHFGEERIKLIKKVKQKLGFN